MCYAELSHLLIGARHGRENSVGHVTMPSKIVIVPFETVLMKLNARF